MSLGVLTPEDASREWAHLGLAVPPLFRDRDEWRDLSQDLHDYAGHSIALLLLQLKALGRFVECHDGRRHLFAICEQVDQIGDDLHRLAAGLRAAPQGRNGLADALRTRIDELCRVIPLAVRLELDGGGPIPEALENTLFNIFQEAITNVVRHARNVRRLSVRLARRGTAVVLIVADDGRREPAGMEAHRSRPCLGLSGMRMRVERFGGRLRVSRYRHGGWVVSVSVPLHGSSYLADGYGGPALLSR